MPLKPIRAMNGTAKREAITEITNPGAVRCLRHGFRAPTGLICISAQITFGKYEKPHHGTDTKACRGPKKRPTSSLTDPLTKFSSCLV